MFNSLAFDVVIGLIFVYILYSLLATILGELISSIINLRAVVLRVAIERILNDGYYKRKEKEKEKENNVWSSMSYWWKIIRQYIFFRPHPDFPNSFAGRFYQYP